MRQRDLNGIFDVLGVSSDYFAPYVQNAVQLKIILIIRPICINNVFYIIGYNKTQEPV